MSPRCFFCQFLNFWAEINLINCQIQVPFPEPSFQGPERYVFFSFNLKWRHWNVTSTYGHSDWITLRLGISLPVVVYYIHFLTHFLRVNAGQLRSAMFAHSFYIGTSIVTCTVHCIKNSCICQSYNSGWWIIKYLQQEALYNIPWLNIYQSMFIYNQNIIVVSSYTGIREILVQIQYGTQKFWNWTGFPWEILNLDQNNPIKINVSSENLHKSSAIGKHYECTYRRSSLKVGNPQDSNCWAQNDLFSFGSEIFAFLNIPPFYGDIPWGWYS